MRSICTRANCGKPGFASSCRGQPFKVLTALLERPGQVVTREELQERLWGKDTVVDFDPLAGKPQSIRSARRWATQRRTRGLSRRSPGGGTGLLRPSESSKRRARPANTAAVEIKAAAAPAAQAAVSASRTAPAQAPATAIVPLAPPVSTGTHRYSPWMLFCRGCYGGMRGRVLFGVVAVLWTTPPHITQITHNGHFAPSMADTETLAAGDDRRRTPVCGYHR